MAYARTQATVTEMAEAAVALCKDQILQIGTGTPEEKIAASRRFVIRMILDARAGIVTPRPAN